MELLTVLLLLLTTQQQDTTCCYYRKHYHNAYCGNITLPKSDNLGFDGNTRSKSPNSLGCIISESLMDGPPKVICSTTGGCLPPKGSQGYWLEGFELNCNQCI